MRKLCRLTSIALIVLVLLACLCVQMRVPTALATSDSSVVRNVTLYCHTNYAVGMYGGRIMNTAPVWGGPYFAEATDENVFSLYPNLTGPLRISGTVVFGLWLTATSTVLGTLNAALFEVTAEGVRNEVCSTLYQAFRLTSGTRNYILAVGGVNYIFSNGSSIQFSLKFTAETPTTVRLTWDDWRTPTQVTLPCVDHITVQLGAYDKNGTAAQDFCANQTAGILRIRLQANITDPFGGYDLKKPNITIVDHRNFKLVNNQPMSLLSGGPSSFSNTFQYNLTAGIGDYSISLNCMDLSGNSISKLGRFSISYFYPLEGQFLDAKDRALVNAEVSLTRGSINVWTGKTNDTGWISCPLPSSDIVGEYDVLLHWKGSTLNFTTRFHIAHATRVQIKCPISDLTLTVLYELLNIPAADVHVELLKNSHIVESGRTAYDGSLTLKQIPRGVYDLRVKYGPFEYKIQNLEVNELSQQQKFLVPLLPSPLEKPTPYLAAALIFSGAFIAFFKRRGRLQPVQFNYFNTLVGGGIPASSGVMIVGNSGCGKTILTEMLAYESLKEGKPTVFITNSDFPHKIIQSMRELGMEVRNKETNDKLSFIDCYSGAAGQVSTEKYFISSLTDLTALSIKLSTCLNELGRDTDVFFDSLTPLFPMLKTDYILSFTHAAIAKVKGYNGRFYFTVGTSVEKEILMKLEETSDCVIEMQVYEEGGVQKRRLRVKKVRGRKHIERWIPFSIEPGRGIVFHVSRLQKK